MQQQHPQLSYQLLKLVWAARRLLPPQLELASLHRLIVVCPHYHLISTRHHHILHTPTGQPIPLLTLTPRHDLTGIWFEPRAKTGSKVPPTKLDALLKEECSHTTCQAEPTPSISSNALTCKPTDRTTSTYLRIVAALKPNKEEPKHIRFTVGGNRIDYKGNVSTPTTNPTTMVKCLVNSIVSTPDAQFMTVDIKDFCLPAEHTNEQAV